MPGTESVLVAPTVEAGGSACCVGKIKLFICLLFYLGFYCVCACGTTGVDFKMGKQAGTKCGVPILGVCALRRAGRKPS
jgi:hypothetical protein